MKSSISIVIPNYNGLELLKRHLSSVVKFSNSCELIIVDDASTDLSVEWLEKNYPDLKIISNKKNLGFAASVNRGFEAAGGEFVLLLNNDVSLKSHTIENLLARFTDERIFGIGALEELPTGEQRGKSIARFERGMSINSRARELKSGPTAWVFAASGMFRKSIWMELGGLDVLFRPAYWEDIDIGYRAWKYGYKCLFEPDAVLVHEAEATMNRVLGRQKAAAGFKNQLIFFWKNVTDASLWWQHFFWIPYHLLFTNYRSGGAFGLGFCKAIMQIGEVMASRKKMKFKLSDREVIKLING